MRPETVTPNRMIAVGRAFRGQTQSDLAEALTERTGDQWTQTMITKLETGRKQLTVEVLSHVSEIQDLPYEFYLEGPKGNSAMGGQLSSLLVDAA